MPLSVSPHTLCIRALTFGELLLIALDGSVGADVDALLVKQGRQIRAKLGVDELSAKIWTNITDSSDRGAEANALQHKLAKALFTDATSHVLIIPAMADGQPLSIARTSGGSRSGNALPFVPRTVRRIVGAPIGNIISQFALRDLPADVPPIPCVGGHMLDHAGSYQTDRFACHDYRLPAELYDGESRALTLAPDAAAEAEHVAFVIDQWRCAPSHVRSAIEGPLGFRSWPAVFPDHEILRVASFVANPDRHSHPADPALLTAWQRGAGGAEPASIYLFVFDLTLPGALATPAAAQLKALHSGKVEATILLPTTEASAFGAETNRATAASQFVDVIAIVDLAERLYNLPAGAAIVMLAGGCFLTPAALDELNAVMAGTSTGTAAAILHAATAGPFALDVAESEEAALDLSQGAAVFSRHAALRQIALFFRAYEGANIPLARLANPQSKILARRPPVVVGKQNGYSFRCIVDAQSRATDEYLLDVLGHFSKVAIATTVIAPPNFAAEIAARPELAAIEVLISLSGDVVPEQTASLLPERENATIYVAADALSLAAGDFDQCLDLLEFSVRHTTISSRCRLSRRRGDAGRPLNDALEAAYDFKCVKAF